jgi:hypothetical protein
MPDPGEALERLWTEFAQLTRLSDHAGQRPDHPEWPQVVDQTHQLWRAAEETLREHPYNVWIWAICRALAARMHALACGETVPLGWRDGNPQYCRLTAEDEIGVEAAVRFLESDPWFQGSGYLKEHFLEELSRLEILARYQGRLRRVVLAAVDREQRREFRRYSRLAPRVSDPEFRTELTTRLKDRNPWVRRHAQWVLAALDASPDSPQNR